MTNPIQKTSNSCHTIFLAQDAQKLDQPAFCLNREQIKEILSKKPEIKNNPITAIDNFGGNDCWIVSFIQTISSNPEMVEDLVKIQRLFLHDGAIDRAQAVKDLCDAIRVFSNEKAHKQPLSSINTLEIRAMLNCILGARLVLNEEGCFIEESYVSLDPRQQFDVSEVWSFLATIHDDLFKKYPDHCLRPTLSSSCAIEKKIRIEQLLDGKEIGERFVSSEEIWELSQVDPSNSNALRICHNNSYTVYESKSTKFDVKVFEFKDLLLGLKNKIKEINRSRLPEEEKLRFVEELEGLAFDQIILSYFYEVEPDNTECMKVLDPNTQKIALAKPLVSIKRLDQANDSISFCLQKGGYDRESGRHVTLFDREEKMGDYGKFMAPVPLKIPVLEKFTTPADFMSEECTYELTGCIIHVGGEYGSGGHYTTLQKVDGCWYYCNDSISKKVSQAEFKDLLQSSYFTFYSKTKNVDPSARKIKAPENVDELIASRRALLENLTEPLKQQNSNAEMSSKSKVLKKDKEKMQIGAEKLSTDLVQDALETLRANFEILKEFKRKASRCKNHEDLTTILLALPESLRALIINEVYKKVSSSTEIIKMKDSNYKKEGRALIDKDFRVLAQVFHKNNGTFGELDFSGSDEIASIYYDLVAQLYQEPINMTKIRSIFEHRKFGAIRDQIRVFVYTDFISSRVSALSQTKLFDQRIEILDTLLQSMSNEIINISKTTKAAVEVQDFRSAKASSIQNPSERKEYRENFKMIASKIRGKHPAQIIEYLYSQPEDVRYQIHKGLCKTVRFSSKGAQEMLAVNAVEKGQEILNKDITKLVELVRNEGILVDILGESEEIAVSSREEAQDLDNLIALLYSSDSTPEQLTDLFYNSYISSKVRDSIRKNVYLITVCQKINEAAIIILSDERHLSDSIIKQKLISTIENL